MPKTSDFFSAKQMEQLKVRHQKYLDLLKGKGLGDNDASSIFLFYSEAGMIAYLLGEQQIAVEFLTTAVQSGFPPHWAFEETDEFGLQWKNYQEGIRALRVGLAAHILKLDHRRDEILAWSSERLCDTERIVARQDGTAAHVSLHRTYAMLAIGKPWLNTESDLALAVRLVQEGTYSSHERPLARALSALVKCQVGGLTRQEATQQLRQLIVDSKRDTLDRVEACFHALYLQSAFPAVFDPILPPLI